MKTRNINAICFFSQVSFTHVESIADESMGLIKINKRNDIIVYGSVSKVAFEIVTFCTFSDNSKNPSWILMKFGHMVENNFYGISEKYDLCPITDRN